MTLAEAIEYIKGLVPLSETTKEAYRVIVEAFENGKA